MYQYIKGHLVEKEPIQAIVETHGLAYRLTIPLSTYSRLPAIGQEIQLFLSHVVREDSETLYAFLLKEERDLFELLTTISGIGPKTAASIIGHIEMGQFQRAIQAADTRLLSKIPGIGKKTAERLVIEMRDKFKVKGAAPLVSQGGGPLAFDAVQALMNLGYHPLAAQKAVQGAMEANIEANKEKTDLAKLITAALQRV